MSELPQAGAELAQASTQPASVATTLGRGRVKAPARTLAPARTPVIVVDTREQLPYAFPWWTVRHAIPAGDYSLWGLETVIAIERKRPVELFTCFTTERDRFRREFEKLAQCRYAALVIEGDIASCSTEECQWSRVSPRAVINSIVSWSIRYGVQTWFAGDRAHAQTLTFRLLEKFAAHAERELPDLNLRYSDHAFP